MARSLLIANDFPPVGSGIATFFGEIWKCLPADQTAVIAPSLPGSRDLDRDYPIPVQRHWLPLSESPQAKVAKVNPDVHIRSTCRRPNMATIDPVIGVAIAVARTFSVTTQEICS